MTSAQWWRSQRLALQYADGTAPHVSAAALQLQLVEAETETMAAAEVMSEAATVALERVKVLLSTSRQIPITHGWHGFEIRVVP